MCKRFLFATGLVIGMLSLLPVGAARPGGSTASRELGAIVQKRIELVKIGEPQYHKGLTVIPLTASDASHADYLTLDEAVKQRALRILEKGQGQVSAVRAESLTGKRIFIMDGEEIVGAKQNRVLNSSVMIGPKRIVELPVSCVEHGRWTAASPEFRSEGTQLFAKGRQMNNADVTANYAARPSAPATSNQGKIWERVAEKRASLRVAGPSEAMHDAYVARKSDVDTYVKHIHAVSGQVGALFAVNGEIIGADIFDQHRTLERLLPKLVRSYALDAIEHGGNSRKVDREDARLFLRRATSSDVRIRDYASAGEGRDVRLSSARIKGAGLVVSSVPVHVALFAPADDDRPIPLQSDQIRPPSERRRNLR